MHKQSSQLLNHNKHTHRRGCCVRIFYGSAFVLSLLFASVFTPVFSNMGLLVLQYLPVADSDFDSEIIKSTQASTKATAYIVLGGGLTQDSIDKSIVLNDYTRSRLQTVLQHYQQQPLPIILSGVESPWMHDWLVAHGVSNIVSENASMNTCENARFTAKRLAIKQAYLVTDAYHMRRAQRQFALNGVSSIAIIAPLPEAKNWQDWRVNLRHSRRTIYELAAYLRDIIQPQENCREASKVTMQQLMTSRKPQDMKIF